MNNITFSLSLKQGHSQQRRHSICLLYTTGGILSRTTDPCSSSLVEDHRSHVWTTCLRRCPSVSSTVRFRRTCSVWTGTCSVWSVTRTQKCKKKTGYCSVEKMHFLDLFRKKCQVLDFWLENVSGHNKTNYTTQSRISTWPMFSSWSNQHNPSD